MPYYIPSLTSKTTCIGNTLSTFNISFSSLDTNLYNLSTYTTNSVNYLSSQIDSKTNYLSSQIDSKTNYLSSTMISVSSIIMSAVDAIEGFDIFTQVLNFTSPNNSTIVHCLSVDSLSANVDIALVSKGTGATLAQLPDNTVIGGDKRGQYATDLQKARASSSSVAIGNYSTLLGGYDNSVLSAYGTVVGGFNNSAEGEYSFVGGGRNCDTRMEYSFIGGGLNNTTLSSFGIVVGGSNNQSNGDGATVGGGVYNSALSAYSTVGGGGSNTAKGVASYIGGGVENITDGDYSISEGYAAKTTNRGQKSFANGKFAVAGDAQKSSFILKGVTTSSTPSTLYLDYPTNTVYPVIPIGKWWFCSLQVIGVDTTGAEWSVYNRTFLVRNPAGTATVSNTVVIGCATTGADTDIEISAGSDMTITSSTDTLVINVTGTLAKTYRWVANLDVVEIGI